MRPTSLSRRRLLAISGAMIGLAAAQAALSCPAGPAAPRRVWRGQALGAEATITLYHPDGALVERAIAACVAEIARLEASFSLYRADSELRRLNRGGRLAAPSSDFHRLLTTAVDWGRRSDGAFDITVQPLWDLHIAHFTAHPGDILGPSRADIERVLDLVDYRAIGISPQEITLARPGMAVTLNGIAQGYITDRVAELLADFGIVPVLANIGEVAAHGRREDGEDWLVGIECPDLTGRTVATVALHDSGLSTSAGNGSRFEATGRFHHIFDPVTGTCPHHYRAVSVVASSATIADALSTALFATPPARLRDSLATAMPATAYLQTVDGRTERIPAG